ncbi:ABC transporter permease [Microbacterium sp. NPDC016588]
MTTPSLRLGRVSPATATAALTTLVSAIAIVAVWQVVAVTFFTRENGTPGAIPPPVAVLARVAQNLTDGGYWAGLAATAVAALTGYIIAVVIALVLGASVILVPALEAFATQLGIIAACIPVAAISPIVVIMSPSGSRAVSVVLAVLAVVFPMIIGVLLGLRAASPAQLDLVHVYGGSEYTAIRRVRLISAVPALLTALKIGAPAAFLGSMTGEFFAVGVDAGIGRLLISQQYVGDYTGMWAIAVLAAGVSALGYAALAAVAALIAPWTRHLGGGAR